MLVYVLTNQVNGKVYIGQHKGYQLNQRWNRTLSGKTNSHLAAAIRKYGAANFSREILAAASCAEELNLLERFFIGVFQSSNPKYGYNKTLGGAAVFKLTKEIRQVLSKTMRKVWRRGTHRKHGEAVKRWWRGLSDADRRLIRLRQSLGRRGQKIRGHVPWNKGLRGLPSARKGKVYGKQKNPCRDFPPFTEQHKRKISQALRRYHRKRRRSEKD